MQLGIGNAGVRCNTRTKQTLIFKVFATLLVAFFVSGAAQAASVVTDTTDYAPGQTVTITGSGYWSQEDVTVQVIHDDGTPVGGEGHDPWVVKANSSGDFVTYWTVPFDDNLGEVLRVEATGQSSTLYAFTTFMDAPGINLDQLQNGTSGTSPEWANGNINTSNSCYAEDDGVPYRYFVTGADSGSSHYFTISMEWTKAGIHAIDYLVDYDLSEGAPIASAGGPCGSPNTPPSDCDSSLFSYPFPDPTDSLNYTGTIPPDFFPAGFTLASPTNLKFYNATIDSIGDYYFGGTPTDRELNVEVYFTVLDSGSVGLFWGGHLAHGVPGKWGVGNGSASIGGAPYHMRTRDYDGGGGQNQDKSIQGGVLCLPPQATFTSSDSMFSCTSLSGFSTADDDSATSYDWMVTGATIDSGQGTTTIYYTVTASDWVYITLIACDSTGGCPGDFCCNEYTDSIQVEVDNTPPQLTCPSDLTIDCGASSAPGSTGSATATDLCDPEPSVSFTDSVEAGACPQEYTIYRIWTASDNNGNSTSCAQIITVQDNSAPVFSNCPNDTTVECDAVPSPASPSATDDCGTATVTYLGETSSPGACANSYTLTRSWEAADECGNADTCVQTITVQDNTAPVITCPADVVFDCVMGDAGTATASDNCDSTPTIFYIDDTTNVRCPVIIDRQWIATDACGNADTCSQLITIQDTANPVITAPADIVFDCDNIGDPGSATFSDNCAIDSIWYVDDTTTSGCSINVSRTWYAVDSCGNSSSDEQIITIQDNSAPTFVDCPNDTTVECSDIPAAASPTATDNCDSSPTVTYLGETVNPGSCPYTITRQWEAVDACGNADTCTQVITVNDTEAPSFVDCPANVTVSCDSIPSVASPTATDNCSEPTVNYLGETGGPDGSCPYTIVRSWEAVDNCGNADTCVQVITVEDNEAPTFDQLVCGTVDTLDCTEPIPDPNPNPPVTDNCDPNPTVAFSTEFTQGDCQWNYSEIWTWVATDACGNADTCWIAWVVVDTTPPTCNVPNDTTIYLCDTSTVCLAVGATDNCDPAPACSLIVGVGSYSNGMWCYKPAAGTEDVQAIFQCTDACFNSCIDTLNVHFVVNSPPTLTVYPSDQQLCDGADTVCIPYEAVDPDNGLTFQTSIGWVDEANNLFCFFADTSGSYCNTLRVTDSCGLYDEFTYCVNVTVCEPVTLGQDRHVDSGFVCSNFCDSVSFPDMRNGCGPFAWYINGVSTNPDTTVRFCVGLCDSIDQSWTFIVYDSACDIADTAVVTYKARVNCPPTVQCPSALFEARICRLGDTVCVSGLDFMCDDYDGNVVSTTLNGQPYNSGDDYCFESAVEGPNALQLICTDECGRADTCTASIDVIVDHTVCPCPDIVIEKKHEVIQGQYENVSVIIENFSYPIGGLNLLIEYDPSALSLANVLPGTLITDCGWEYFTFRNGAAGNCGSDPCPSGKLRITAIAETNNGPNHPDCFELDPSTIADLVFLVTNDRTFECQFVPIKFCWYTCSDNTLSNVQGDSLYISSSVNDWVADGVYNDITDVNAPFPSLFGANITCENNDDDNKPDPIRCIDFFNGGIDIICADSIDDKGDINMNGVPNEVADAVLLGNYFVYGISVFTVNLEGQIAASDVNSDGAVLTVADLVYLIRIILGDANAYSKVSVPVSVSLSHSADGILSIDDQTEIGAAFILVPGEVTPVLLAQQMDLDYNFDGAHTRILVWSTDGNSFTGDFLQVEGDVSIVEMATAEGNPVALNTIPTEFLLNQNYPNPFNPTTTISFSLPVAANYELSVYNINGQQVAFFAGSAESAGLVEIQWDARSFASGIYFYKLHAGDFTEIKKMMLIK